MHGRHSVPAPNVRGPCPVPRRDTTAHAWLTPSRAAWPARATVGAEDGPLLPAYIQGKDSPPAHHRMIPCGTHHPSTAIEQSVFPAFTRPAVVIDMYIVHHDSNFVIN